LYLSILHPGGWAFISDCPAGAASLTRVELSSGAKTIIANLTSPSGCAVGGDFAYVVEQGGTDGQLLSVSLKDAAGAPVGTKKVLLDDLAGPMGVAIDVHSGFVYVEERHKNRVRSVSLSNGKAAVFATGLNAPIGVAAAGASHLVRTNSTGV
jgi:DNA-binding beta-propeller fold protein YncE